MSEDEKEEVCKWDKDSQKENAYRHAFVSGYDSHLGVW